MLGIAPGVPPGPLRFRLTVTLQAHDTPPDTLRGLVETARALAPMSGALQGPVEVVVEVVDDVGVAAGAGT
jgi:hypothetical protein